MTPSLRTLQLRPFQGDEEPRERDAAARLNGPIIRIEDLRPSELATVLSTSPRTERGTGPVATVWLHDESTSQLVAAALTAASEQVGFVVETVDWPHLWSAARRRPMPHGRPVVAAVISAPDDAYVEWFASKSRVPVINASEQPPGPAWQIASALAMIQRMGDMRGETDESSLGVRAALGGTVAFDGQVVDHVLARAQLGDALIRLVDIVRARS